MSRELGIWMRGTRVGVLEGPSARARSRDRLRLSYSPETTPGEPLLSVALPVRPAPLTGPTVHAFFSGLLPEGRTRETLAYDFEVASDDVLGLLGALGRDCAGALVLVPPAQEPPGPGEWIPVDDEDIAARLSRLHIEPLGIDGRVRVSLAGMQAKLLLARRSDGGWHLPLDGAPSTHIIKPAIPLLDDSVPIEGFCLRAAAALGIAAAPCEVTTFGAIPALVVTRYDRAGADEQTTRIHQEDFCQALGLAPGRKYERSGTPSFAQMADVLRRWARPEERWRLLELMVLNVCLGNADAHAKNYSLLHPPDAPIRLAPAYDVLCTLHDTRVATEMGLWVNGVSDLVHVTASDLVAEAAGWGLPGAEVADRVADLIARIPDAIARAAAQVLPPPAVLDTLERHLARLSSS